MGAVPEGYDQIVLLDGVSFDTRRYGENEGYKFKPVPGFKVRQLSPDERETIDQIISELGSLSTDEIVDRMHEEDAYQYTSRSCFIEYSFADRLSLA